MQLSAMKLSRRGSITTHAHDSICGLLSLRKRFAVCRGVGLRFVASSVCGDGSGRHRSSKCRYQRRNRCPGICWQVHPVTLGLFNFVNAWSVMLWPLMLADKKGAAVKNRFPLYLGTQVRKFSFVKPCCLIALPHHRTAEH